MNMDYLKNKTILIVEDDEALRESLVMEFEYHGAHVLSASSGNKALEVINKGERIDAILSDVRMPDGNGVDLLKNVKDINVEVPVMMFMTGFTDLSVPEAYHMGAEAILPKPFELDDLHDLMKRIMTPKTIRWESDEPCGMFQDHMRWNFKSLVDAAHEGKFFLGRGGFFIPDERPVLGFKKKTGINFTVTFDEGSFREISGCGVIRYVNESTTKEGSKVGYAVEFEHLPVKLSQELVSYLIENKVKSFIPMKPTLLKNN